MFKKKKHKEDDEKGVSEVVKAGFGLLLIIGMFIAACKFGDWCTEQDMKFQYGEETSVKVD